MSKAKLKKALVDYYEGYCLSVDADEMLNTKVDFGGKITTVAKIAREENFSAEETAAFCAGIENFDVDDVLTAIKNHDYDFHPDVGNYVHLGDVIREQLVEANLISEWLSRYLDLEHLGWEHFSSVNCVISDDYGYFELF